MDWETKAKLYRKLIQEFLDSVYSNRYNSASPSNYDTLVEEFIVRFTQALDMVDEEESE